jgi:DNA ligase (NAD+)
MYYCPNAACPAQRQQRIEHFASRGAMDIRGIGEKMSAILSKEGFVNDFADLYYLDRGRLLNLDRMAEKSVDNLLDAIDKSKKRPLARFIYALGIRHVGEETAELLAKNFDSIDKLASATREELTEIDTIGPKIADSIIAFFQNDENKRIIKKLKAADVLPEVEKAKTVRLPLEGREFVITGRLDSLSRQEAEARIRALGGSAKSDVTRKTGYLVVGAEPGSKLVRARSMGVKQISESELLEMIKESGD